MLVTAPVYEIALSEDLLITAKMTTRATAAGPKDAAGGLTNVNWWISTERRGDPYAPSLVALGLETPTGAYNGRIAKSAFQADMQDRLKSVVYLITAIGDTIVDSQACSVVDTPTR